MIKEIKIEGLSQVQTQYGLKVTFQSGKEKPYFYSTKKDGTKSKAYEQFQQYRYQVGDTVKAEIKEEPKSFPDKQTGKTIAYTDRRILYFSTVEGNPDFERPKPKEPTVNINLDGQITNNDLDLPF